MSGWKEAKMSHHFCVRHRFDDSDDDDGSEIMRTGTTMQSEQMRLRILSMQYIGNSIGFHHNALSVCA